MKKDIIEKLRLFKERISSLKKAIAKLETQKVSRKALREEAEAIADLWVEDLRSVLEHKFKFDRTVIEQTSQQMKTLHVLSRPNNQKSSYTRCLNTILKNFDDKFILPLQQLEQENQSIPELGNIFDDLSDEDLTEYLDEAIKCAQTGFFKASIVLGWCAAIDQIQKKFMAVGFEKFNSTSTKIKNQTTGKYKRWNKEFRVSTLSELQTVFDTDLIVVLEGMELIDGNQAQRLEACFQYRNHSAHPGEAPIEPAHVVSFFTDIKKIILQNEDLA